MSVEIFKGQSYRLELNSGIDLSGATLLKLLYVKPDAVEGFWPGTLDSDNTSIFYDVTPTNNDMSGVWKYQLYVEVGGKTYYGSIVQNKIIESL